MGLRKSISDMLQKALGRKVKFSVKKVGFQDLARCDAYFVDFLEPVCATDQQKVETELRSLRYCGSRVHLEEHVVFAPEGDG